MRHLLLLVTFIVALSPTAPAQFVRDAPGLRDMKTFNDMADVLETMVPALATKDFRTRAIREVDARAPDILRELKWVARRGDFMQGGYLIRIRTQTNILTNHTVPLGGPEFVGVGQNPSSALAAAVSYNASSLEPLGSSNLRQDTHFIWVTVELKENGEYRLKYGPVSDPETVKRYALAVRANNHIKDNLLIAHRGWGIQGILETLHRESQSKAEFAQGAAYLDEFVKREERIAEHKATLDRYLSEAAAANRLTKTLDTFSRILTVATLAAQVSAALKEMPQADIDSATNAQELTEGVKKHESVMKDAAALQGQKMKPLVDEHRERRPMVIKVLEEVDLPPNWRRTILN